MRARPKRQTDTRRPSGLTRRLHVLPAPAEVEDTQDPAHLRHERRARASGGPEDLAHYHCACGFAFEARVTTTVTCPHCGAGQAW